MAELLAGALVAAAAVGYVLEPLLRPAGAHRAGAPAHPEARAGAEALITAMAARVVETCPSCGARPGAPALYCPRCGALLLSR